eukprot:363419-Chlamydomonas_euryale.AAC.5
MVAPQAHTLLPSAQLHLAPEAGPAAYLGGFKNTPRVAALGASLISPSPEGECPQLKLEPEPTWTRASTRDEQAPRIYCRSTTFEPSRGPMLSF